MKRFAAHYIYLPTLGFFRQHVVEIATDGTITRIFPLTEELSSTEWHPGVIALLESPLPTTPVSLRIPAGTPCFDSFEASNLVLTRRIPVLFFPFDFIEMQTEDGVPGIILQ
jgi:hypothetical protein